MTPPPLLPSPRPQSNVECGKCFKHIWDTIQDHSTVIEGEKGRVLKVSSDAHKIIVSVLNVLTRIVLSFLTAHHYV